MRRADLYIPVDAVTYRRQFENGKEATTMAPSAVDQELTHEALVELLS
jgi:hypothetical protein